MKALLSAVLACTVIGCADERWVVAELEVPPTRGAVCLVARGATGVVFTERYAASEANGSVTFVEGDTVSGSVVLEATLRRGGRRVTATRVSATFGMGGPPTRLRLGECVPHEPAPARTLGTVDGGEGLVGADADEDGLDEIYVDVGDGARDLAGTPFDYEALVGLADLDGDCHPRLWGLRGGELVDGADGAFALEGDAVAFGDAGEGGRAFTAGTGGVSSVTFDGASRSLSGAPSRTVAVGDLDGDGFDEVVAGGESGIEVFFGGEGGPTIAPGATPGGWTARHLALGDLDADGDLDLVVAREGGLGVARNRGDGFLEATPVPGLAPLRVVVGDVNGDCVQDVVAIGGDGASSEWLAGAPDGTLETGGALGDDVIDATFADPDGRGVQLLTLHADGRVEARAP